MKKHEFFSWATLVLSVLLFAACDNEIIEGSFNEAILCDEEIQAGMFSVHIDTINYQLESSSVEADLVIHANDFVHMFISVQQSEHGILFLNINYPEIGVFDLTSENEFGGSISNHHEGLTNFGTYFKIFDDDVEFVNIGFTTFSGYDGYGELEITALDYDESYISGNFSFSGKAIRRDAITNQPILDDNGEVILDSVEITCGYFDEAPFLAGTGSDGPNFFREFYAEVDGEEFIEAFTNVDNVFVNGVRIIYITAITDTGRTMRIDVPTNLGLGTFDLVPLTDGSRLTAIYNNNNGAEGLTANPGTITITELDNTLGLIEATFSFTGIDPFGIDPTVVEVTNGELLISFNGESDLSEFVEADIDGIGYDNSGYISTTVFELDNVTITSVDSDNSSIEIIFPKDILVGSYNMKSNVITGNEKVGLYTPAFGVVTSLRSVSGTLTILRYDLSNGEIEGVFDFEAEDIFGVNPGQYSITNGRFVVRIP